MATQARASTVLPGVSRPNLDHAGLLAFVGFVVVVCSVATLVRGSAGALGAGLAVLTVVLFLGSTPVVLGPVARRSALAALPVAVLFFLVKAFAAMAVLFLLFDVGGVAEHVDRRTFGLAAVVCSLAWTALALWSFRRRRVLTYDLGDTPS